MVLTRLLYAWRGGDDGRDARQRDSHDLRIVPVDSAHGPSRQIQRRQVSLGAAAVGVDVHHSDWHAFPSRRPELLDCALGGSSGCGLSADAMPAFAFQQCSGYLTGGGDGLAWRYRRSRGPP